MVILSKASSNSWVFRAMGTISSLFSQATDVAITNHQGCAPALPSDSDAEATSWAASWALDVSPGSSVVGVTASTAAPPPSAGASDTSAAATRAGGSPADYAVSGAGGSA